ncbi:TPA: hypothetical protein ACU967_006908 [Burkholderia contaminans]|nr:MULTISPECIES: hypothetical protein [Burkholderia]MBM6430641.1 hypothetical protein [Burkholderia contaminans]MBR8016152.1 hypothetical protein [Burkholderia vietnamiensis]MCA7881068.1 hypothetical protein [Burkholderia contaminans]MDN8026395.1 hypothetical protein [Burkholderia contaminans]PRE01363.1 hypothetical protein C6P91_24190 [Burkholderia multivorans]
MNRKLTYLALGFCMFAAMSGCKQASVDSLEGEYGVAENGKIVPLIKVEKTDRGYVFDDYQSGKWRTGTEVARPLKPEEFEQIMGAKIQGPFDGLQTKMAMFAKVQPGFTAGDFKTSTGYMMAFMLGPIELTKM